MNISSIVETCNPLELPSVSYKNRIENLPGKPGIYFVFQGYIIIYVGESTHIQSRWCSHSISYQLHAKDDVSISWLELPWDDRSRWFIEWAFIIKYKPILNLNTPRLIQLFAAKEKELDKILAFECKLPSSNSMKLPNLPNEVIEVEVMRVKIGDSSESCGEAQDPTLFGEVTPEMLTTELTKRYSISRSTLSSRMEALEIVARRSLDKKFYVSADALASLDLLNECLKQSGATLAKCVGSIKHSHLGQSKNQAYNGSSKGHETDLAPLGDTTTFIPLVHEIAAAIRPQSNPLQHLECLERAAAAHWLLSTLEIKQMIGVKPHGSTFTRGSFKFVRSGKIGASSAWRVEKISIIPEEKSVAGGLI